MCLTPLFSITSSSFAHLPTLGFSANHAPSLSKSLMVLSHHIVRFVRTLRCYSPVVANLEHLLIHIKPWPLQLYVGMSALNLILSRKTRSNKFCSYILFSPIASATYIISQSAMRCVCLQFTYTFINPHSAVSHPGVHYSESTMTSSP